MRDGSRKRNAGARSGSRRPRIRGGGHPAAYGAAALLAFGIVNYVGGGGAGATAESSVRRAAAEAERRQSAESRRPGQTFRDCDVCPEMVVVPAGTFMMGSPASEEGRDGDEGPLHEVTLRSFAMGVMEVSFVEWDACALGDAFPPRASARDLARTLAAGSGSGCDRRLPEDPSRRQSWLDLVSVNWEDAQAYVRWLSERTGAAYRLPSESEWEYAARAGTTTPFHSGATLSPADTFLRNAFGLIGMYRDVWEWMQDCWHDDYRGAPSDGTAWERGGDCGRRVLRGGHCDPAPLCLRSANRSSAASGSRTISSASGSRTYAGPIGFRVARTLD